MDTPDETTASDIPTTRVEALRAQALAALSEDPESPDTIELDPAELLELLAMTETPREPEAPAGDDSIAITLRIPRWSRFDSDDFHRLVVNAVADRMTTATREAAKERAEGMAEDEIRRLVLEVAGPIVMGALEEGVRQTNGYGEPVGKPTPLRELIVKAGHQWLEQRVDKDGRSDGYGDKWARGEWYIRKAVGEFLDQELKTKINAVVTEAREAMVAPLLANVREAVLKALKP